MRAARGLTTKRLDGDSCGAVDRLNSLVTELKEGPPSEQIDGLANLSIALAGVGYVERGKQLQAKVPEQCLGYALPPEEDPRYAIWRDIPSLRKPLSRSAVSSGSQA